MEHVFCRSDLHKDEDKLFSIDIVNEAQTHCKYHMDHTQIEYATHTVDRLLCFCKYMDVNRSSFMYSFEREEKNINTMILKKALC